MFSKLELIGGVVAVLSAIAIVAVIKSWKDDAEQLPIVRAEFRQYRTAIEQQAKLQENIVIGIQNENTELRRLRESVPVRVVRLHIPARSVPAPAESSSGDSSAGGAPSGLLPEEAGPDIGGRLYALADAADEVSKQLRACQMYSIEVGK